nr:hypothetical protein [Plasmodium elongatum]
MIKYKFNKNKILVKFFIKKIFRIIKYFNLFYYRLFIWIYIIILIFIVIINKKKYSIICKKYKYLFNFLFILLLLNICQKSDLN